MPDLHANAPAMPTAGLHPDNREVAGRALTVPSPWHLLDGMRTRMLSVAAALLLAAACSSSGKGTQTTAGDAGGGADASSGGAPVTSQVVGTAGATVTAQDGTQVTIPPGALAGDVTITIVLNPSAPPLTQGTSLAAPHQFGPEGQQFLKPVSVTLAFPPQNLPAGATEQQVVVYAAPAGSSDYQVLPTTIVDATHVAGQTTHFSNICPGVPHTPSGDGGGGDGGAPVDAAGFDAAACPAASGIENADGAQACAAQHCCAQLTTCISDPACSPIGQCFEATCQGLYGNDSELFPCADQCAADASANGSTEFFAAFDCIHSACGGSGAMDASLPGDASAPSDAGAIPDAATGADSAADAASCPAASGISNADGARDCASKYCCAQLTTCVNDPECSPIGACYDANCQSGDGSDPQSCAAQCAADGSASGASEFNAAFDCIHTACGGGG